MIRIDYFFGTEILLSLFYFFRIAVTPSELMINVSTQAENVTHRITLSLLALSDLKKRAQNLNESMENLKDNTTKLQEENVEGKSSR